MKTLKTRLGTFQGIPVKAGMKKLFFLVFVLFLFLLQGCKPANQITLHVKVSDDVCQSSQWVYWFSGLGNNENIVDSCYLEKGQHSFTMKKVILNMNEDMLCWLTFTKHGPTQALLILNNGENVKLAINKKGITKTNGSQENYEWYHYADGKAVKVRKKMDSLTDVLETTKDSLVQRQLIDSINYLQDSLDTKLLLYDFNNIKTPKMFLLRLLAPGRLSQKTVDSLVKIMKLRFPNNKRVQEYPKRPKYPPATLHSKQVNRRLLQIWAKRNGHNYKRTVTPKLSTEQKKALGQIKPLKLGDHVNSLSFKGLDGKRIVLKDIHTPYVLIDFWASWCNPCREEVPELKLAQAKYKDRLTIYAVSLDKNKSNWRKAIHIDKSSMLTQVIEDSSEFTQKRIQKLFGIKFIPRNFLLDQHRKIIAINIPGDSLVTKLGKLCRK